MSVHSHRPGAVARALALAALAGDPYPSDGVGQMIFSAEMIRALIDGEKTVTRRLIRTPTGICCLKHWMGNRAVRMLSNYSGQIVSLTMPVSHRPELLKRKLIVPPWPQEQLLAVRETWAACRRRGCYIYRATNPAGICTHGRAAGPWRSPLHLPRAGSRLVLRVLSVRPERLHVLTDAEARLEGLPSRAAFRMLWKALHGHESWRTNPRVWRLGFEIA